MGNLVGITKLFLKRNSSTILTCIGAAGVVATSVMAVKATPKAMRLLEHAKEEKGEELTTLEKIKVAGPAYIPAVTIGASTIACIFGANALNKRTQASLMSAYALVDNAYKEYKHKVQEVLGEESDREVVDSIAKDVYEEQKPVVKENTQLFFDFFSLRYFESSYLKVRRAEEELNDLLESQGYVLLNQWYDLLGLEPTGYGMELGWYYDYCPYIKFCHNEAVLDDGLECCIISAPDEPTFFNPY